MNKKAKIALTLFGLLFISLGIAGYIYLPNPLKKGWSGSILVDTVWEGNITVSGDLIVVPGVTLTVKPGTNVKVLANQADLSLVTMEDKDADAFTKGDPTADPKAGGNEYQKTHITIIIAGKIISKGTAEKPITFTSAAENPTYTDWWGINVMYGEFEYTEISWCVNPLYAQNHFERLTLEHCYIAHSWAAALGWMEPADGMTQSWVKYSTIEDCGHEAIDTHSSGHLEIAYNLIQNSQVGLNFHNDLEGTGNHLTVNVHHNLIRNCKFPVLAADGTTANLTHCIFQSNEISLDRWQFNGYKMAQVLGDPAAILLAPGPIVQIQLRNSIIIDSALGVNLASPGSTFINTYNNFDNVTVPLGVGLTAGAGTLFEASQFIDRTNDFHLIASSPLINAGDPIDGSTDLGIFGGSLAPNSIGWKNSL